MTINQLCCVGLILAFIFACLAVIVWALRHVAALDREILEASDD